MSRWNRLGDFSGDCLETARAKITSKLWDWLSLAINDSFTTSSPVDDVEFYIRDGDELIEVWQVSIDDMHYSDGRLTRRVLFRPNKKAKRRKYI